MHVSNLKESYSNGCWTVSVLLNGRKQKFLSRESLIKAHDLMGRTIKSGNLYSDEVHDKPGGESEAEMKEEMEYRMECAR